MIPLEHYLIISALLFCLGIFGVITRRNAVSILMGVELILNSANINFVTFSHFSTTAVNGQVFAIFVIIMAAAEAAVALAIVLNIYRNFEMIEVDKFDSLKG